MKNFLNFLTTTAVEPPLWQMMRNLDGKFRHVAGDLSWVFCCNFQILTLAMWELYFLGGLVLFQNCLDWNPYCLRLGNSTSRLWGVMDHLRRWRSHPMPKCREFVQGIVSCFLQKSYSFQSLVILNWCCISLLTQSEYLISRGCCRCSISQGRGQMKTHCF